MSWSNSTEHLPHPTWKLRSPKSKVGFYHSSSLRTLPLNLKFHYTFLTDCLVLNSSHLVSSHLWAPWGIFNLLLHKLTGCVISLGSQLAPLWGAFWKVDIVSGSLQTQDKVRDHTWHLPFCIAQELFQVLWKLFIVQELSLRFFWWWTPQIEPEF